VSSSAHLTQFSPIFPVKDLRRALAHYQSLGFATRAYEGGDEYGFADRDGVGLHLTSDAGAGRASASAGEAYLYVDDADDLYAEWTGPGIGGITRPVRDTAYRLREGSHVDPDGNVIRFGSPVSERRAEGVARLESHLESHYGIRVSRVTQLDVGVFRIDRRDGASWVARFFPARRSVEAVVADGEVLRLLAAQNFPAERPAVADSVSVVDGRGVLVTEHVEGVPRSERRAAIREMGGLRRLGELLGRLHTLPGGADAVTREGGAWHHLAEGGPGEELAAAARMLADAEGLVPLAERDRYQLLVDHLEMLDGCQGLPRALVHPDFVMANVVASPGRGMVVVDWAGTGQGPRLWPLAWLLYAEGAKDLRRVDLVVAGYRRHVTLEPEELARLDAALLARPVIFALWAFCMGQKSLADAARDMARFVELAAAIGARARAAFSAP
jgi:Ser/Thr protein kinase RdoA (MazF antagonist)